MLVLLVCCCCLVLLCSVSVWLGWGTASGSLGLGAVIGTASGNLAQLATSGRAPPIVTWQNRQAFKITYQGGQRGPGGTDSSLVMAPKSVFPCSKLKVSFKIWFADNFVWDATGSHRVGGKLGGIFMGSGKASGGNYSSTAASYRLSFKDGGYGIGYFYPQLKRSQSGSPSWAEADQSPELERVSSISTGIAVWRHNNPFAFKRRQWNTVEMYCALNTPGKKDGVMQLTVNGKSQRLTSVRYRYDNMLITGFHLVSFFGGGDLSYAPPATTHAWFADYKFTKMG
ncbi:hypothetical protein ACK3TF_004648 [Chlorella vulgaris]